MTNRLLSSELLLIPHSSLDQVITRSITRSISFLATSALSAFCFVFTRRGGDAGQQLANVPAINIIVVTLLLFFDFLFFNFFFTFSLFLRAFFFSLSLSSAAAYCDEYREKSIAVRSL